MSKRKHSNVLKTKLKHAQKDADKIVSIITGKEDEKKKEDGTVAGIGAQRLNAFIERIERLEEEKAALGEDIKEIYAEAKGVGFDTKTIRRIISLRKVDEQKRREENELLKLYAEALGMQHILL